MLSWSAQETGRQIDLAGVVDPHVDPGVPGGRPLAALGRAAAGNVVDRRPLDAVAGEIGLEAAFDAAAVAASFEIMNRVVDAVGLPIGPKRRAEQAHIIDALGLAAFPHAGH